MTMAIREEQRALAEDLQKVWREYQEYQKNPEAFEKTEFPDITPYETPKEVLEHNRKIFEFQKKMKNFNYGKY
jgi:hypothetical protein